MNQSDSKHKPASQSAEDEPIQHGPHTGDDGKVRPSEGIEINRTAVGEHPNVPDEPKTQTPN